MAKKQYHYISVFYGYENEKGENATATLAVFCSSETQDSKGGIPTMGYLIKVAKDNCEQKGQKYKEGSLFIVSIVKLTKSQYDALNDRTEPKE